MGPYMLTQGQAMHALLATGAASDKRCQRLRRVGVAIIPRPQCLCLQALAGGVAYFVVRKSSLQLLLLRRNDHGHAGKRMFLGCGN